MHAGRLFDFVAAVQGDFQRPGVGRLATGGTGHLVDNMQFARDLVARHVLAGILLHRGQVELRVPARAHHRRDLVAESLVRGAPLSVS